MNMNLMILLLFSLLVYAMAFIVVYKQPIITKPIEWIFNTLGLREGLSCFFCMSGWSALALAIVNTYLITNVQFIPVLLLDTIWYVQIIIIALTALIGASAGYLIDTIQTWFESNSKKDNNGGLNNREMLFG